MSSEGGAKQTFPISEKEGSELKMLRTKVRQLERNSNAQNEFLANMSHELRTPMTSILGMAHMLLETELNPDQQECAEVIRASCSGLLTLVNETLDLSKLEVGKSKLESIPFNLCGLVEQVCKTFRLEAKKKGLQLLFDYGVDVPQEFNGDPGRLRQILTNLLSNAIKFTHRGQVSVKVKWTPKAACDVLLSVEDTGIGIPRDCFAKVFEKFEQVDATTTRRYGGTGLGMAIALELAKRMGGDIKLSSQVGVGSRFEVLLPLQVVRTDHHKWQRAEIKGKAVLVVDAHATARKLISKSLIRSGMLVKSAGSLAEAMSFLQCGTKERPFDFVITDDVLPDGSGFDIARHFDADEAQKPHLIMLSSVGKRGDREKVSAAGFVAYLSKPTPNPIILELLAWVLGSGAEEQEALITRYTLSEHSASDQLTKNTGKGGSVKEASGDSSGLESPCRIELLIVEDDVMIQKLLSKIMKKLGQDFECVSDGEAAVEHFRTKGANLILMDWHLPKQDGLEATRQIRALENGSQECWIVGLSAGGEHDVRSRCLEAGMDDHLMKPFAVDAFLGMFRHAQSMVVQLHELNEGD